MNHKLNLDVVITCFGYYFKLSSQSGATPEGRRQGQRCRSELLGVVTSATEPISDHTLTDPSVMLAVKTDLLSALIYSLMSSYSLKTFQVVCFFLNVFAVSNL